MHCDGALSHEPPASDSHGSSERPIDRVGIALLDWPGDVREDSAMLNLNSHTLDELAARIGQAFENSPAKDLEKNVKALLASSLARLDLVTRQEFDIQREVLQRTREKVEMLETRVAELEARAAGVVPPPVG
jgi:ubiquinone biosynthesis accessory factor UbiK